MICHEQQPPQLKKEAKVKSPWLQFLEWPLEAGAEIESVP